MAKLYRMYFRTVDKDYTPERKYAKKKNRTGTDSKLYLGADGSVTVLEEDIKKYWEYGDGPERIDYAGEMDDSYFRPSLSEPDFVDEQIKSKKNGETIGFQG